MKSHKFLTTLPSFIETLKWWYSVVKRIIEISGKSLYPGLNHWLGCLNILKAVQFLVNPSTNLLSSSILLQMKQTLRQERIHTIVSISYPTICSPQQIPHFGEELGKSLVWVKLQIKLQTRESFVHGGTFVLNRVLTVERIRCECEKKGGMAKLTLVDFHGKISWSIPAGIGMLHNRYYCLSWVGFSHQLHTTLQLQRLSGAPANLYTTEHLGLGGFRVWSVPLLK